MIQQIIWPERPWEPTSPFCKGDHERPLRLTFHTSTLADLPQEEQQGLDLLYELSALPEIEAYQTDPGTLPHFKISSSDGGENLAKVRVFLEDGWRDTLLHRPDQLGPVALRLTGGDCLEDQEVQAALQDLTIAHAHRALRQDVLVTSSPGLLIHSGDRDIRDANPRSVLDATQLVGLFLRSRGKYTYKLVGSGRIGFDRGLFYLVLARHRLPQMWRYFSACVHAGKARNDDTLHVGQSVLTRCQRALEARDFIGELFYVPQDNNTRDATMYHFDYLTLLLSGALDAQAVIAHRAYLPPARTRRTVSERSASFRNLEFLKALKETGNAERLWGLLCNQHSQTVIDIVWELRNTIHRAGLPSSARLSTGLLETSHEDALARLGQTLWQLAETGGSPAQWGLSREHGCVGIEPYACAATLVSESLHMIDAVASATEVERLFGDTPIPTLPETAPDDHIFGYETRRRLALLG